MVGGMGAASYRSVSSDKWHGEQHLIGVDQVVGGSSASYRSGCTGYGRWRAGIDGVK